MVQVKNFNSDSEKVNFFEREKKSGKMSTIHLLCKSENNMNNNNIFQESNQNQLKEETIR